MDFRANGTRAPPRFDMERGVFLLFIGLIWLGVVMGFGGDIAAHPTRAYLPIVHLHAVVFVGWLVLFTTQATLIRLGRPNLHRRLGLLGVAWAAAMVVVGPATALLVDAAAYAQHGEPPAFLAVQLTDIMAFAGLTGAAFLLRREMAAHKRLMLLGTLYIADAGYARWLGDPVSTALAPLVGKGPVDFFAGAYLATDILVLAFGAYDIWRHQRPNRAWVWGAAWSFGVQALAVTLYFTPAWTAIALTLIGR